MASRLPSQALGAQIAGAPRSLRTLGLGLPGHPRGQLCAQACLPTLPKTQLTIACHNHFGDPPSHPCRSLRSREIDQHRPARNRFALARGSRPRCARLWALFELPSLRLSILATDNSIQRIARLDVARRGTRRAIVSRRAADRLGRATDDMDAQISGAQGSTIWWGERVPRNAYTSELVCAFWVSACAVCSAYRTSRASVLCSSRVLCVCCGPPPSP